MPKSAKPTKILGTLALIFSLVLLNIGAFFLAIPFLNEGDGAISFPEELAASANTIGIIICKENNNYVIKYSSDERIIARKYLIK